MTTAPTRTWVCQGLLKPPQNGHHPCGATNMPSAWVCHRCGRPKGPRP